ncbi:MAG: FecR family protein [Tannerella sp.]|jgi:ferric-dicitrate binding protein FerR (iron transport regulator)|nr:FecR family protein [Tannerella sp.]
MKSDYFGYRADQLLDDDYFIHSELHPTHSDKIFWSELENEDKILAEEIKIARAFLENLKSCAEKESMTSEDERELWNRINRKNHRFDTRFQRSIKIGLSIAASVALLIGFVWYYQGSGPILEETDYLSMLENMKQDTLANNVQLILSNDESISIDGKETSVEYQEDGSVNINEAEKVNTAEKMSPEKTFNQLVVPKGKRSTLTFHDGTKLWVNSGSKVIYPESFDEKKREIFVEGEVFLDVKQDSKKPFIVKTKQLDVTVLGTQFDISAYESEEQIQVVLVDGKVEVRTSEKEVKTLSPSQMYSYNPITHENEITHVDVNDYVAWKDGYYQFNKQKMNVIFQKISNFYGVDLDWNKRLNEFTCSGKLDLKDDIDEVLHSLKKAVPIKISNNNEKIYIDVEL